MPVHSEDSPAPLRVPLVRNLCSLIRSLQLLNEPLDFSNVADTEIDLDAMENKEYTMGNEKLP